MARTLYVKGGFPAFVTDTEKPSLPHTDGYTKFYRVEFAWTDKAKPWYVAKGYATKPKEYVAWYPNGGFYSGSGNTILEVLENAAEDAWKEI